MDLSAGALCDILSSAQTGDVQVSSGLPGASGLSVSLAVTSSAVPLIVSDVRLSHPSTLAILVAPCVPVSFSSVLSFTPLSDIPLLVLPVRPLVS